MKQLLSMLLILAMSISMLAGCAKTEDTSTESTNTSTETKEETTKEETKTEEKAEETEEALAPAEMSFVYAGGDPLVKELISERVQKFNDMYEAYEITELPSGSGGYLDFVKTQDAIGEFPDMLDSRDTTIWVDADKLAELPESVVALLDNPPALDGKYYAAPISIALPSVGFYYNKTMFNELGLEEPTTYAEFEELCNTIRDSGTAPIVQGGKDIWHMGFLWSQMWLEEVFQENPDWLADKRAGEVSFTDDNVQTMIKRLASFYENDYIEKGWLSTADNQLVSFLLAEKAAMFFSGSWMVNQVKEADPDFDLGWFPLPDADGNISLLYGSKPQGFALSKEAAEDPAKVALFEAFCAFWYDEENYVGYVAGIVAGSAAAAEMDVDYGSEFPDEFSDALDEAVFTDPFWNAKWGEHLLPGGFRNFTYKAFQEMVSLGTSPMELGELLDKQWAVEIEQTE